MFPSLTAALVKCAATGDGGNDGSAAWLPGVGVDNDVATLCERLQAGVEPQIKVQTVDASTLLLGCRLIHNTHTEAHLVLKLVAPGDTQREDLFFNLIDWSAAWLQLVLASDHHHTARFDLLAAALDASDLREAATAITIRVATLAGAEGASIGLVRGERVELLARSHTANFDPTTSSNRALTAAMAEALDEGGVLAAPPSPPDVCVASFAHDQLCRHENATAVCSLPLRDASGCAHFMLPSWGEFQRCRSRCIGCSYR